MILVCARILWGSHGEFYAPKVGNGHIKRLRSLERPQYRLGIDEIRVFYDVTKTSVEILAIVSKEQAQEWLDKEAIPSASGGSGQGQG